MLFGKGRMGDILQSLVGSSSDPLLNSLSALSQRLQQKIAPQGSSAARTTVCWQKEAAVRELRNCCLSVGGSGECF